MVQHSPHRVGTIRQDPVKVVVDYALMQGMTRERVENLIGMSIDFSARGDPLPAVIGPTLLTHILEDGIGSAPSLEIAQSALPNFFGGLEHLILNAPTGMDALQALTQTFAVFHDKLEPHFDVTAQNACFSIRFNGDESDNGACNEIVLSVLMRLMRTAFSRQGQPNEARLRYSKNGTVRDYEDFFACPIQHYSKHQDFALVFKRRDLEWRPGRQSGANFQNTLEKLTKQAIARRTRSANANYQELVNAAHVCARNGLFNAPAVAATAGLNLRTAQRLANTSESSLVKLIEEARLLVLREHLSKFPNTRSEDLSALLGFSDERAFRRALKAWTGESLSVFRQRYLK